MDLQTKIADFLNKVGIDKALHFLVGGLITAIGFMYGSMFGLIAFFLAVVLAYAKEKFIDAQPDWVDFKYSVAGAVMMLILAIPTFFI